MKRWLAFIFTLSTIQFSFGQDYLWPTDASRHLTSSFGESRPRRFHMGIDVKTWGQSGYKAIATRDGFVKRMRVSPFGYGRVLYIQLDTGETAVYAHLEKFNDRLQAIAEREQERRNEFRIDKYFKEGVVPVTKGEVIAYTGQSGIGVPHLHFEIRDIHNRPTNPLKKDFTVLDTTKPIVTKVVVSPLEPGAMVDGDYLPQSYQLTRSGDGFVIKNRIHLSGKVGFAIGSYDRANGVNNRFGAYRHRLYIDGSLQFESKFERLTFDQNKLIQLAQDYALARNGWGRLHKLYRESSNSLNVYSNLNSADGALHVPLRKPATQLKNHHPGSNGDRALLDAGQDLSWGIHDFIIIVEDYFHNETIIEGQLLAGSSFMLNLSQPRTDLNRIDYDKVSSSDGRVIEKIVAHAVNKLPLANEEFNWRQIRTTFTEFQSQPSQRDFNDAGQTADLIVHHADDQYIRIVGVDELGLESFPVFVLLGSPDAFSEPFKLEVQKSFFPKYLRFEAIANQPLAEPPKSIFVVNGNTLQPQLTPLESKRYFGIIPLKDIAADSVWLSILGRSITGEEIVWHDSFANKEIQPSRIGTLHASNDRMKVEFSKSSLYWPIYGRVAIDTNQVSDSRVIAPVYSVEPRDVPLRGRATVKIAYPDSIENPEKLGVCYKQGERWIFIDNKIDQQARTVSAGVLSMEHFALIRDEVPPVIIIQTPAHDDSISTPRPTISVHVRDTTSGFESERSMELQLDGQKVIAEYDPERQIIFHRPKVNLTPGTHLISVSAHDRSGNFSRRQARFFVR